MAQRPTYFDPWGAERKRMEDRAAATPPAPLPAPSADVEQTPVAEPAAEPSENQ